jgi:flagellar biosynthesis/type III secretory pathway M-ring protein FliF/YscJ
MLADTQPTTINLADFLLSLLPWVVVFVVVWFLVFRVVRRQSRQIELAQEQRRGIQERLDRIIALLEERGRGA